MEHVNTSEHKIQSKSDSNLNLLKNSSLEYNNNTKTHIIFTLSIFFFVSQYV